MSDKSFGDHTNRNIVKNPLLSTAVTGLSIEDLTHKAVLLPVTQPLDQISRSDQQQGSQARTLAHPKYETSTFPSGDAFSNITLINPQTTSQILLDSKKNVTNVKNLEEIRNTQSVTQSKASAKCDDDFDVNEYIARLQGSRYVSAPLHSHLKEEQNANLEATEENLEEINLNETVPAEIQQSLTADIAQNFSQLPTVLPHVASAVFSSFSNMLSYKSREQTPDHPRGIDQTKSGYDDVQFQKPDIGVPLMGVEEYKASKEVAPPPKEPPIGGTSNFRITTKKKYAQIPGLSTRDGAQTMTYPPVQNIPPLGQNLPHVGQNFPPVGHNFPPVRQNVPPVGQNFPPVGQNLPPVGQNIPVIQNLPSVGQNMPPLGHNVPDVGLTPDQSSYNPNLQHQNMPPFAQNVPPFAQNVPFASQNILNIGHDTPRIGQSEPFDQSFPPVGQNEVYLDPRKMFEEPKTSEEIKIQESNANTQPVAEKQALYNIFNPATDNRNESKPIEDTSKNQPNLLADRNFFTLVEHKEPLNPPNTGNAAIIPPPPMFSNLPRKESQSSVGKSILPPSVARRISANQPIIKPDVSAPSYMENIFVPAPVIDTESQADNNFSSGFSSAFVPAFNSMNSEPTGPKSNIPPPSQINVPSSIPPVDSAASATYLIPLNEAKPLTSAEASTFFTPKEIATTANTSIPSSSTHPTASPSLPPAMLPTAFLPTSSFESTASRAPAPNYAFMNTPPASIFTPSSIDMKPQNAPSPMIQSLPQNVPPTFFNPLQVEASSINVPHPITQMPPMATEPPKPVAEPPKATGNVNFRMTKKRPQYYAGPIEGIGAISNNFKPTIAPVIPSATSVEASNFQGTLFTPEQPMQPTVEEFVAPNIEQASVPFDISRPVELASSHAALDINKPQEHTYGTTFNMRHPESQNYEQEYNTPFDMVRDPTDPYNEPKQESKGFGIIGSLKSKLSSIDINKIQSTVTTFFDPAYNDTKVAEPVGQDIAPYQQQQQFGEPPQGQSNFDIFVPNVDQNQYSQFTHGNDYSVNDQYHQTQPLYSHYQEQSQNVSNYSTSSYSTDPNYLTDQVYSGNPLYDNTQISHPAVSNYNPQENIPEKVETISSVTTKTDTTTFYDPNAFTQGDINAHIPQTAVDFNYQNKDQGILEDTSEIDQKNINYFDSNTNPNVENLVSNQSQQNINQLRTSSKEASDMTYYNPNVFTQETRQIWAPQESHDSFVGYSAPVGRHDKDAVLTSASEIQEPIFYNPDAFAVENQHIPKSQQQLFDIQQEKSDEQEDFSSSIHKSTSEFRKDSESSCDFALNTFKYNIASLQKHETSQSDSLNVPLLPAASFFDNPVPTNLPLCPKSNETHNKAALAINKNNHSVELRREQFESEFFEISKTLSDMPAPIGTKTQSDAKEAGLDNKDTKFEKEHQVKEANLIESLSKNSIPILGVSTIPLFGLSAIIPVSSIEVTESEMPLFDTIHQTQSLLERNTAASFFENKEPENKIISENQVKRTSLDLTALTINDVKNVLVIEPPQENIVELLKRNASSSKLENLPEKPFQNFIQQSDNSIRATFQDRHKSNLGDSPTESFFKHSDISKEVETSQIIANADKEQSELNICETCREVSTPEHEWKHKETEDVTTQLIENITSRLQLSNPLTVPLQESDAPIIEESLYDRQQLDEITHVAEETFETLQVQSATELLDEQTTGDSMGDYVWTVDKNIYPVALHGDHDYASGVDPGVIEMKHDHGIEIDAVPAVDSANPGHNYEFKLDPNAIGFFGNNSLFFDNLPMPTNASDEIKAEIKHSQEDIVLPRQMSIPTAPPEEEEEEEDDDPKLDEPGVLDVHSIEQDAKKDFPLEEEFIIEPSTDDFLSTDDDKIELRERKRSSEDSTSNDTFTNRIERFKKKIDNPDDGVFERKSFGSPPISMASYFDTGNYAVESHFRNSLVNMRIPPGFEEEYARKFSGVSLGSAENATEPYIPDTSTQTRPINTPTYSSPCEAKENIIGSELRRKEKTETLAQAFFDIKAEATSVQAEDKTDIITEPLQTAPVIANTQQEVFPQNVQSLPNPMNFFSANVEEPKPDKPDEPAAEQSFNRLASYFSMPPAQPDHSKSFFELSQSQNHYRHDPKMQDNQKLFFELSQSQNHYIDDDTKNNIKALMKDLISPQNIKEHVVKTVNYFTVELDNDIKHHTNAAPININIDEINLNNKRVDSENKQAKVDNTKDIDSEDIMKCEYCRRYIPGVNTKVFIVKTAVNETSEPSSHTEMPSQRDNTENLRNTVNFADIDVEKQSEGNVTVINEHREGSEYTPVKHHWFYRIDVEEKSVWRGFSNTDSTALEEAYQSSDLNEQTVVATDGGRYDVNVVGRLRLAVYWKEKPTNVRRCSWFYKGTTDARYVPYTESVAEKLEDEYRHGLTTGEWHRKLVLPNNEMVIMHGPAVMVHFLHSGATDAFSTPPQAASRPRVVRRSYEESEIEESEPSKIDHLLLLCHGVGSACDMRFRSVEEVVEDFRATSLQLLQSHYRQSYDNGLVSRVEVLPISWHEQLHSGEMGVDRRLARVTLDSIPRLRAFTNHTVLDVLFYTSPVFHQTIIDTVCSELNRIYSMFRERNPHFDGCVSLGGHSLGSVILYDLLCHQSPELPLERSKSANEKQYVTGTGGTGQPVKYPQLVFPPAALYALGSPIAIFECIRGVETLGMEFSLPTCKRFFNIFHPYDPIAYRIEPLINPLLQDVKPSQIPHHKGRKRMHLELKDTMARVGADLKQKLIESLRTTWNKWKTTPPTAGQLEKVVEEEMEKEQLRNEEEPASEVQASAEMLGRLNGGRRVDYVLQEAPLEMINEYLFAMSSHVGYWESEDTMLLMLREIYDSMGVQPDSTVPQQSMTVHRTKTVPQDETSKAPNEIDSPSTSRGNS